MSLDFFARLGILDDNSNYPSPDPWLHPPHRPGRLDRAHHEWEADVGGGGEKVTFSIGAVIHHPMINSHLKTSRHRKARHCMTREEFCQGVCHAFRILQLEKMHTLCVEILSLRKPGMKKVATLLHHPITAHS